MNDMKEGTNMIKTDNFVSLAKLEIKEINFLTDSYMITPTVIIKRRFNTRLPDCGKGICIKNGIGFANFEFANDTIGSSEIKTLAFNFITEKLNVVLKRIEKHLTKVVCVDITNEFLEIPSVKIIIPEFLDTVRDRYSKDKAFQIKNMVSLWN